MKVSFQPVTYLINGFDVQGQLVFLDGRLTAVLTFLEGDTYLPDHQGLWSLEAGFDRCDPMLCSEPFKSLDDAVAWVVDQSQARPSRTALHKKRAVPQPGGHNASAPPWHPGTGHNTDEVDGSL